MIRNYSSNHHGDNFTTPHIEKIKILTFKNKFMCIQSSFV